MALSDAWLKANNGKTREKIEERADRDGLSIRVSRKGKIVFQIRYRLGGKPARLDLGTYPLMGLKKAREENQRLRAKLEQGHDPKIVRELEKQTILEAKSLKELFRLWHDAYCSINKKNHDEIIASFELHVFNKIGDLPANKITLHEWLEILEQLARSTPHIADRILTNTKQMYNWAIKRKLVDTNPLININATHDLNIKKVAGERSLSHEEIKLLWLAIERSRMNYKNRLFIKLCLIYACRNGELRLSKKKDFDFKKKIWTVPPENHKLGKKTNKPLLRPIIPETEALIKEAMLLSGKGDHVFKNANSSKPMGQSAALAFPYNIRQWLRRRQGYEMAHWSMHDLRKTARTNFSELTEPHVAEIMLGHKLPGVWQVYDKHDYLDEQAKAYSLWCERLSEIVN